MIAQPSHILSSPIEYLKGVGPQRAELLKKELRVFTFADLLQHFPFRYVDRTQFVKIREINTKLDYVQFTGKLVEKNVEGAGNTRRLKAYITDGTGEIELVWFQGIRWVEPTLQEGKSYLVYGKPNFFRGEFSIVHPEISLVDESSKEEITGGKMQPVYSSTEKLSAKGLHSRGIEKYSRRNLTHKLSEVLNRLISTSTNSPL